MANAQIYDIRQADTLHQAAKQMIAIRPLPYYFEPPIDFGWRFNS
jgi:hypothetical protein